MLNIQGTGRIKPILGRRPNGEIIRIDGMQCVRKHMINPGGWEKARKAKHLFAFVSSPQIYGQDELRDRVKGWCHAFRDDSKLPRDVPNILLPESDFMDEKMVIFKPKPVKYDYFYFTINAQVGVRYKGLSVFIDVLPTLCKHNLKGLIIVYFPNVPMYKRFTLGLNQRQRKTLEKYSEYLTYHWGILKPKKMNTMMTSCRFGLFPNVVDNSPRIISESLIRNVPVMINNDIHGGWHYVNKDTGVLFKKDNKSNTEEAIDTLMSSDFSPREYYREHYGFEKSSRRLASFINRLFGLSYTHAYFRDYQKYLEEI